MKNLEFLYRAPNDNLRLICDIIENDKFRFEVFGIILICNAGNEMLKQIFVNAPATT